MRTELNKALDPLEVKCAESLCKWFVAEDAISEYVEGIEEEEAYPDLLGKTLAVSAEQYPRVYSIVENLADCLGIRVPPCFLYADYNYTIDSEGLRRPRLEISSRVVADFSDDELTHVLAKEMFHIAAGHLRYEVITEKILAVISGAQDLPGLNLVASFGGKAMFDGVSFRLRTISFAWFKYACFSAENFAIAYTGNIEASARAMLLTVLNERELAEAVDLKSYIRQIAQIESCNGPRAALARLDEVIPYGPYRILNMLRFANTRSAAELADFCTPYRSGSGVGQGKAGLTELVQGR